MIRLPPRAAEDTLISALVVLTAMLLALLLVASVVGAQTPPPPTESVLSDVDRVKAENLRLRAQVLELQRGLAQCQLDTGTAALNAERTKLEAEFRTVLKPQDGETFNWSTLRFEKPATKP